ncbi:methyltransferase domain-containing protein [Fusobacterium necrophorum]|uniref:O-methyltransferase n=1 Tax=Fusobacterium necrophorum TaxID=859 RepID=UPI00087F184F|nr:class I SAM-dependent methyltransferase [Fusobacterium necrophorum]AYZ74219.1 methyltransferase domain-containing protein [Fusobacterium necrophorum]AZW09899.1 methyltransferase domain-containing protein [Fusobacterium necrophorum subsp. necrophorum]SDB02446.1 Predicted O-methyltransferase YrrM [Fusobacterium necrophorum]SQD08630.1 protein-L-isoaspartate O-methyltransferase [Fusobacterium necrophorum subsp. necrophorum]
MDNIISNYVRSMSTYHNVLDKHKYEQDTGIIGYCPVIDTTVAMFLKILIDIKKPKKVLELGTSIGYSTTIIAQSLSKYGGKITTIEFDKNVVLEAKLNFEKYGVSDVINVINDDVTKILPNLNEKFDMIFLDLYNGVYLSVLENCIDLLDDNGLLIADDTLFPVVRNKKIFKESNKSLHKFNMEVSKREDLNSLLIPLDDGITLIVKNENRRRYNGR